MDIHSMDIHSMEAKIYFLINEGMFEVCQRVSQLTNMSKLELFALYKLGEEWGSFGSKVEGDINQYGDGKLLVFDEQHKPYAVITSKKFLWDINMN